MNDSVKQNAGITSNYKSLLRESVPADPAISVNEEHAEVIELTVSAGQSIDLQKLKLLLAANNMDSTAIYQWQNHYVIFSKVQDLGVMQGRIQNNFPEATVKAYHDMFYQYSKAKNCTNKTVAKEWDHILLTANLVADPKRCNRITWTIMPPSLKNGPRFHTASVMRISSNLLIFPQRAPANTGNQHPQRRKPG